MRRFAAIIAIAIALVIGVGCASAPDSPTPTPGIVLGEGTIGAMAELGRSIYGRSCAGCHGAEGGGVPAPALIGPDTKLARYGNARALLDYISVEMPVNRPGELAPEAYEQLLALLLLENGISAPDEAFDAAALDAISLE